MLDPVGCKHPDGLSVQIKRASGLMFSFLSALCIATACGTTAQAEPNFDAGVQFYKSGNYQAAVQSFQKVDVTAKQSTVLYYQALCNQQLGNGSAALRLYRQVATSYPNSQEARLAGQYLDKMGGGASASAVRQPGSTALVGSVVRTGIPGAPVGGPSVEVKEAAMTSVVPSFKSAAIGVEKLPDACGVPFHRSNGNHMLMNATVGGRQMEVMFDTGAASCYFGRDHQHMISI